MGCFRGERSNADLSMSMVPVGRPDSLRQIPISFYLIQPGHIDSCQDGRYPIATN